MVWCRFPYLPLEFWDEECLFRLARSIGKPIVVDARTLRHEYSYFVAVLVDIDFQNQSNMKLSLMLKIMKKVFTRMLKF